MGCDQSAGKKYMSEKEFSYNHEFEMYAAILNGNKKKVEDILKKGFGINYLMLRFCYRSCLHIAAEYGKEEIFLLLLSLGANINQRDRDDIVPLFIACNQGHLKIVEICFQNNARTTLTSKYGLTLKDYINHDLEKQFRHLLSTYSINSVYQRVNLVQNPPILKPKIN